MAQTLYGARGGSAGTSDLYTINPLTGAETSVGPIGYALTGLAFDVTDGTLYGMTSSSSSSDPISLISIDPVTGAGTLIGATGQQFSDIACDSAGNLVGWAGNQGLWDIDKVTGVATQTVNADGTPGSVAGAISFDSDDVLWYFGGKDFVNGDHDAVYTVAPDGPVTFITALSGYGTPGGNGTIGAASFNASDALYANDNSHDGAQPYPTDLITIVSLTGVCTLVGASLTGLDALAFAPDTSPPIAPPTQVFGGTRFYEAPPSRMIVGDLDDSTLTFLDHLALDRSVTVTRAAARVISGRVPSDNPEVNIPAPDPDGEPFLSEGTRIVSWFRREAPGSGDPPWVIRARGIVFGLSDDADTDHATSTFTAYDPWKYWYRRPVLRDDGTLGDVSYAAGTRANEIIAEQFGFALAFGPTIFTDFGQTGFYTGVFESTEPLPDGGDGLAMTFRSGTTLGEMCDLLAATGTCDIVNDPIYDIFNRPGLLTETSVYQVAGSFKPNAVMGWDRWPRSLVGLSRQVDGTERANIMQMYAGQGGPPVPQETDAASLARFGEYWALQYLPGVPSLAGAHTIAQRQLALLKDGLYTYALSPASERAPLLFQEYREADTVPVYADERFRDPINGVPVRVESIPIVIGDDELERVNQMLVSFAPESGS